MKQSIVEVIVYLLEAAVAAQNNNDVDSLSNEVIVAKRLEDAGFSREVVASAFDWLRELIEQQCWYAATKTNSEVNTTKTMRVFDPEENARINLEARGFILSLEYVGILDTKMREIVISQLMHLNQRSIGLIDAKWVVLLVLLSKLNKNIREIHGYLLVTTTLEMQKE